MYSNLLCAKYYEEVRDSPGRPVLPDIRWSHSPKNRQPRHHIQRSKETPFFNTLMISCCCCCCCSCCLNVYIIAYAVFLPQLAGRTKKSACLYNTYKSITNQSPGLSQIWIHVSSCISVISLGQW